MLKYHYVYRITNIQCKKHYYGTRSSKCHPSEDLGIKYFSSSYDKDFIKDQHDNPQNYKYKIVKILQSRKDAISLEVKLHEKFDVGINESFYNKAKQTTTKFDTTGIPSKPLYGKMNGMYGKKHTKETIEKIRKSKLYLSDESRKRMSEAQKKKVKCPHCGKICGSVSSGNRYHFDKCKNKKGAN